MTKEAWLRKKLTLAEKEGILQRERKNEIRRNKRNNLKKMG